MCPAWGLLSQAVLLNRALYGTHLPTWCSQAPALRVMGNTLSALPRLPHSLVSNHAISSNQRSAAFKILPVCTSLSPNTGTSPADINHNPQQSLPWSLHLSQALQHLPRNIPPCKVMDRTRIVCAGSVIA